MRDHELIEALATIEKEIKAFEHSNHGQVIGTSTSLLDVIRESQRVLVDALEDVNALPKDDQALVICSLCLKTLVRMRSRGSQRGPQHLADDASN